MDRIWETKGLVLSEEAVLYDRRDLIELNIVMGEVLTYRNFGVDDLF